MCPTGFFENLSRKLFFLWSDSVALVFLMSFIARAADEDRAVICRFSLSWRFPPEIWLL
jgi:hypothetical protein